MYYIESGQELTTMNEESGVIECKFVSRPNRFLVIAETNNRKTSAFCPNPGRMHELMVPGKKMFIRKARKPSKRKTSYDVIAVEHEGVLVSIDSNLPNRFLKEMLMGKELPQFASYNKVISEPSLYGGRVDFKLEGSSGITLIEVKSCTLVEHRHALFPDAPTTRGARHMISLAKALEEGLADDAAVVFVIQRPDADLFSPNDQTDPWFGDALRHAEKTGVRVIPIVTKLVNWKLEYQHMIPYDLEYFIRLKNTQNS